MKTRYSTFDYTLVVSRKNRYLVVGSPDFGHQIEAVRLDLGQISTEAIGRAVLVAWNHIARKLHELERRQEQAPKPRQISLLTRHFLTSREAARLLGISVQSARKLARLGKIPAERTVAGRFRFPFDELSELLAQGRAQTTAQFKEAV